MNKNIITNDTSKNKRKEWFRLYRNTQKYKDYQSKYKKTHKKQKVEYSKFYRIRKKYGISKSDWFLLLKKQKNKCAICQQSLSKDLSKLCTDHCHKSGKVRGIVHNECNLLIGFCKENKTILQNAIKYIQTYLENKNSLHSIKLV